MANIPKHTVQMQTSHRLHGKHIPTMVTTPTKGPFGHGNKGKKPLFMILFAVFLLTGLGVLAIFGKQFVGFAIYNGDIGSAGIISQPAIVQPGQTITAVIGASPGEPVAGAAATISYTHTLEPVDVNGDGILNRADVIIPADSPIIDAGWEYSVDFLGGRRIALQAWHPDMDDLPEGENSFDIFELQFVASGPGRITLESLNMDNDDLDPINQNSLRSASVDTPGDAPVYVWMISNSGGEDILRSANGGESWEEQHNPTDSSLEEMDFVDEHTGWIVGSFDGILKTTNRGAGWEVIGSGDLPDNLLSVDFLDENIGLVGGFSGKLFKTKNGGDTWEDISDKIPWENFDEQYEDVNDPGEVFEVQLIDEDVWFAAISTRATVGGSQNNLGLAFKTTDGGETWENIGGTFAGDASFHATFYDENVAFLNVDDSNIRTTDGGDTWEQMEYPEYKGITQSFFHLNQNTAWTGDASFGLFRTENAGETWDKRVGLHQFSQPNQGKLFHAIHFMDELHGWAVLGNRRHGIITDAEYYWTIDGGETWESHVFEDRRVFFSDIFAIIGTPGETCTDFDGDGYCEEENGVLPWDKYGWNDCDDRNAQRSPGNAEVCGDTIDNDCKQDTADDIALNQCISCVDADNDGFCVQNEGILPEGKQGWGDCDDSDESKKYTVEAYIDADKDGYGVGRLQQLCQETKRILPGYTLVGHKVDCNDNNPLLHPDAREICGDTLDNNCDGSTDENSCVEYEEKDVRLWVAGADGSIFYHGENWIQQRLEPKGSNNQVMIDIYFHDDKKGWVVSNQGKIYRTTNRGGDWDLVHSEYDPSYSAVHSPDGDLVWAVGGVRVTKSRSGPPARGTIVKAAVSNDGGETWETRDFTQELGMHPSKRLKDVFFVNENVGWMVSSDSASRFENGIDIFSTNVFKTTNGGLTWTPKMANLPPGNDYTDIQFVDENVGWLASKSIKGTLANNLYKTTDGGESWELKETGTTNPIRNMHFVDEKIGWITTNPVQSSQPTRLKTYDGGDTWVGYSLPDRVYAIDDHRVWSSFGGLSVSSDGGVTYDTKRRHLAEVNRGHPSVFSITGIVYDGPPPTQCTDFDGDGYCEEENGVLPWDKYGWNDCDPSDTDVYRIIEGYVDQDDDGFGTGELSEICSGDTLPAGYVSKAGDCHDDSAFSYPGYVELCNDNFDNDCNQETADDDRNVCSLCDDGDGDGFCVQIGGNLPPDKIGWGDCHDGDFDINPYSDEICDGLDNDCDDFDHFDNTGPNGVISSAIDEELICNSQQNCGTFGVSCPADEVCNVGRCVPMALVLVVDVPTLNEENLIVDRDSKLLFSTDKGSTWDVATLGDGEDDIDHVIFPTIQIGWAFGKSSALFKTTNSGATWEAQDVGVNSNLRAAYFTDHNNGVIIGDGGWLGSDVFTTTNGGQSWEYRRSEWEFHDMDFIDQQRWVGIRQDPIRFETVLITNNAGIDIEKVVGPASYAIDMINAEEGVMVGVDNLIGYTIDSGHTWRQGSVEQFSLPNGGKSGGEALLDVQMFPNKKGWAVGALGSLPAYNVENGIAHSIITPAIVTGRSEGLWKRQESTIRGGPTLDSVYLASEEHGWAAGQDTLLYTSDGGKMRGSWDTIDLDWEELVGYPTPNIDDIVGIVPMVCGQFEGGDIDSDAICFQYDNCPEVANFGQTDADNDGEGDACDTDDDGDGLTDAEEVRIATNPLLPDTDGDSVIDSEDNCPTRKNQNQRDVNNNGQGDVCDGDSDGDGIVNEADNCPFNVNIDQTDSDADGNQFVHHTPQGQQRCDFEITNNIWGNTVIGNKMCGGDVCDPDDDNDEILDLDDNCPSIYNPEQTDSDGDGVGDLCDVCRINDEDDADKNDADGDGLCERIDRCPDVPNPDNSDIDNDGLGDACDTCPNDPSNDGDDDGICADDDNCPNTANEDQADTDGDGEGDACDGLNALDNDDDGILNEDDDPRCLHSPAGSVVIEEGDNIGCLIGDIDFNECVNVDDDIIGHARGLATLRDVNTFIRGVLQNYDTECVPQ